MTRRHAEEALAPLPLEELVDAAILEIEGDACARCCQLLSFRGPHPRRRPAARREGSGPRHGEHAREHVARPADRPPRGRIGALDLGTGSGVQALLATAARRARRRRRPQPSCAVLRAPESALQRDRRRRELGRGQLAGAGARPSVRSRRRQSAVRHLAGRGVPLPRHRRPAATSSRGRSFATARPRSRTAGSRRSCATGSTARDDWEGPVARMGRGLGCDALLLRQFSNDPIAYAMVWNSELADTAPGGFGEGVGRWVAHYRRTGIEQIATGFVILRRRLSGRELDPGVRHRQAARQRRATSSSGCSAAADFLHAHRAAAPLGQLLSRPWRLLDGHRLSQSTIYVDGAYVGEGRHDLRARHRRARDDRSRGAPDPARLRRRDARSASSSSRRRSRKAWTAPASTASASPPRATSSRAATCSASRTPSCRRPARSPARPAARPHARRRAVPPSAGRTTAGSPATRSPAPRARRSRPRRPRA